jgi:hypothetical protein
MVYERWGESYKSYGWQVRFVVWRPGEEDCHGV